MSMRIAAATGSTRWNAHTALVHLRKDCNQLVTDATGGADPRTLAADKAALVESRQQLAQVRGSHQVDVIV